MGEVYRAHDSRLDRDVALKVLPDAVTADADRLARFEREAKALARIEHPNILTIHEFGDDAPAGRSGRRDGARDGAGHGGLHGARAGPGGLRWMGGRTCSPWAACSTKW